MGATAVMDVDSPDYTVQVRVKNGRIYERIKESYDTVAEFCRDHDISQQALGKLINMQQTPKTNDGEWRTIVLKLSEVFQVLPEDLFNEDQLKAKDCVMLEYTASTNQLAAIADNSQQMYLESPSDELEDDERREVLARALSTLPRNRADVVRMHYGLAGNNPHTWSEIASKLGVSQERVRQIHAAALRQLRHPARHRPLLDVYEPEDDNTVSVKGSDDYARYWLTLFVARSGSYSDWEVDNALHYCDALIDSAEARRFKLRILSKLKDRLSYLVKARHKPEYVGYNQYAVRRCIQLIRKLESLLKLQIRTGDSGDVNIQNIKRG